MLQINAKGLMKRPIVVKPRQIVGDAVAERPNVADRLMDEAMDDLRPCYWLNLSLSCINVIARHLPHHTSQSPPLAALTASSVDPFFFISTPLLLCTASLHTRSPN